MKKIKKFCVSIGICLMSVFLRVVPVLSVTFYGGNIDYDSIVTTTNKKEITGLQKISEYLEPIITILLPIILFIIGLIVLLNKKLSTKTKITIVILGILLVIFGFFITL